MVVDRVVVLDSLYKKKKKSSLKAALWYTVMKTHLVSIIIGWVGPYVMEEKVAEVEW